MGFCIYCNQNVPSDTSCPKCYRTITSKTERKPFGSIFTAQKKVNQTDKWQDTYSKKFNSDVKASTSTSRKMPQFSNKQITTIMKICAHCKEKKEASQSTAYNTTFYCTSCLTEKLACPACKQHFTESENKTQYNQHLYHTTCFKCNQCKSSLNPIFTVLDKEGNPSCRVCQFKNNHDQTPFSASVSTPLRTSLVSSRSTLTNGSKSIMDSPLYTKYQQQRRASVLDAQNTLRQEQQIRMNNRETRSTSLIPTDTLLRKLSKEIPQEEQPPTPVKEEQPPAVKEPTRRKKKVIKRPCKECGLHIAKKDYRGLRMQNGELYCFHKNCLICTKCHQNFSSLEFCTDGIHFYHPECSGIQSPTLSRQGSPMSEEDEAYPQTPPPQNAFFDIVSDSPTTTLFNQLSDKETTLVAQISCNACGESVTDTYLELANNVYHKECLLCAGCNKTVPTDRQLMKHQNKLYCDHCTPKPTRPSTGLTITIKNDTVPKRNPTVTTPSDIFKSRKKTLPPLGGVRTCARCNKSMPFSDELPGPNASRWHKKCLQCAGCNKQMDSGAHMTVNRETGLCLVHCRDCLDDTPTPRFVRKV